MSNIDSKNKSLQEVFSNKEKKYIFRVPEFQRDFVWGEEEVNQMFDDFEEDSDFFRNVDNNEGYLLGNIYQGKIKNVSFTV